MKRAALVLATSVALFICAVGNANATTRKYVSMPSNGSVVNSGNGSSKSGTTLSVPGNPIEGEYIPSSYGGGSKGTKLPVKPKYDYSIPRTIKGMSGSLRGGVVGVGLSIGLQYMLDQVGGFIDENGQPVKRVPDTGESYQPGPSDLKWTMAKPNPSMSTLPTSNSPEGVCLIYAKGFAAGYSDVQYVGSFVTNKSSTQATCNYQWSKNGGSVTTSQSYATRTGETCPAGYQRDGNNCLKMTTDTVPLTDADFDLMEAAAAAKDSEWLKDRLRDHCEGGLSPESCYESLRDSVSLSGPSSVTENGPTSTTVGPTGTTTTSGKTDISITYGDNYYDYRKTSTVVKTNPDGTTETTTETEPEETTEEEAEKMPEVTDLYKPYIDKLKTIETDVAVAPGVTAPIGYSSWYAFGGGCSEISAELPVIGSWQTNYCPLIYDWVRPVLAFIFVMFTWHYCRSLWSEAVTQARPM